MEAPRRQDVEDAHDLLDKYGKTFATKVRERFENQFQCYSNNLFDKIICHIDRFSILQDGNTLLHLNLDRPRVYIYIFASAGVPVNIQNTVRNSRNCDKTTSLCFTVYIV